MSVNWPIVFLLLIPLFLIWYLRPFANVRVRYLRLVIYFLLVAALAGIGIDWQSMRGTLLVVVDRSRSMSPEGSSEADRLIRQLELARPANSTLGVVSFGAQAQVEKLPVAPAYEGLKSYHENIDSSNVDAALELALRQIPYNTPGRIVLISDGEWSGINPVKRFEAAASREIGVDFVDMSNISFGDMAITALEAPLRVMPGEVYTLQMQIESPIEQFATAKIRCNDGVWRELPLKLRRGNNFVYWSDSGKKPGIMDYQVRINGPGDENDPCLENNSARRVVEIYGRKPLLLLSSSPSGNFAELLRNSGFELESYAPSDFRVTPRNLARYSGVVLENVTAGSIGMDGCQLLADMVRNGAIGLMITGGRQSFAVGGYYKSALESILPVSLEQRREVRKSSMALMVALDRSGSMAMPIGKLTKMDLANQATLEAFRQLQERDEFGLLAVDSTAHSVLPLQAVAEHSDPEKKILGIESMGGGIFTFTALRSALSQLSKSKAGIRHLILFADAADAEEPGEYQALLAESSKIGITVSVIGLGTEQDCDAIFLKDVAARGGGEIYFSNRADELPQIFVQDVFTMARSAFIQEKTAGYFLPEARLGGADTLSGGFEVGGYNLCYIRPEAEAWALTDDEFNAPLAAVRLVDLGRVSAYTGEADGEYTGKLGQDERGAALLSALAGYMQLPEDISRDYLITQKLLNGALQIDLHLKPDRESDPWLEDLPQVNTIASVPGGKNKISKQKMNYVSPDRLSAVIPIEGASTYLSTVSWSGIRPIVLSPVAEIYSPEFRLKSEAGRSETFAEYVGATGGRIDPSVAEIWAALPKKPQRNDVTPYLLMAALLLFLLEVAERHLNLYNMWFGASKHIETKVSAPDVQSTALRHEKPEKTARRKIISAAEPAKQEESMEIAVNSTEQEKNSDLEANNDLLNALRRARRK